EADDDQRDKRFYDRIESQEDVLNQLLSDRFSRAFLQQTAGMGLRRNGQDSRLNLFLAAQRSYLQRQAASLGELPERSFWYLMPQASWEYDFTDSKNIELNYSTRVRTPALEQLQPIIDNSNALSLYQGNPDLRPEYQHEFSGGLHLIDGFSFTNFFLNLSSTYVQDRIINELTIDSLLRQVRRPINTDYEWQNRVYASFSTPLRSLGVSINLRGNLSYTRGFVALNQLQDLANRWNQEWSFSFGNRKKEQFDWELGTSWNYSQTAYQQQDRFNQNYSRQDAFALFTVFLPAHWVVSTEMEYQRYSNESFGQANDFTLWQASISKSLLKHKRLLIKLSVFDILNQNTGLRRQNAFNYFEETRANALGRYAMLSVTYKINALSSDDD
ncbi:MAG: TonB-dependent receptor, partial [Lewinella sp.]|nr:TonB-dependent receptor [Lewinella sp.]